MGIITPSSITPNLQVLGSKQQFEIPSTETTGTLAVVTTRSPTDENPTSTNIVSKTILEDGFFLEYKSFGDATKNTATFGLTKKGTQDPIFVVKNNKTIDFKYSATGSISGGSGGGATDLTEYAKTNDVNTKIGDLGSSTSVKDYVDSKDTSTLTSSKAYTDSEIGDLGSSTSVKDYVDSKVSSATSSGSTNTLSGDVTIKKNTATNVTTFTYETGNITNNIKNGIIRYVTPNGKIINIQNYEQSNGTTTNIGANTSWFQILDYDSNKTIFIGMPLKYFFVTDLENYTFQNDDLITKKYVDQAITANIQNPVLIGCAVLVPSIQLGGYTGFQLWSLIKSFMGYGEWRVPGDPISPSTYPLASQRLGDTVPQMVISNGSGGTININQINGKMMYVFRVL